MKDKAKILLVEDDTNLGTILTEFLAVKKFDVTHSLNGEDGFNQFKNYKFDLCLIDVMMPKMDGFTLAKKIRMINKNVPILFVTAKSMLDDKIEGFKIGADDYVTKPFSMEELILRINAIMKRTKSSNAEDDRSEFKIGEYEFDFNKRVLAHNGIEQRLTQKESDLLRLLCINKNRILERSEALIRIWKDESYFTGRSMDVYITKLRNYLKLDKSIEIINVHGTGFKLISK
ncbi:MAG: DNA-binding response regulator [Ignavibacteriae bacterium HGW-Ignavibacteriae-3]|nr:MAG: DNA-binding response regulator [Ignavibacteriae bacterium HGW-Ignavibacteriae-3]